MPDNEKDLARFASKSTVGEVDRQKGIVYGVSIITKGEAKGHFMYVDDTMLEQVLELGKAKEPVGLKSRFDHPGACSRAIGTFTGRFHNFRRDGDKIRADEHLSESSAKSPEGDLKNYILDLAEEDPNAFATSIVFRNDTPWVPDSADKGKAGFPPDDDPYWYPHARVAALHHCDIVDEGAANDGLFGRPDYFAEQAEAWAAEHPNAVGKIISKYYDWKQKKETSKMADELKKDVSKELADALSKSSALVVELATATGKIEAMTAEAVTKLAEATTAGKAGVFALVKDRLAKYKDAAFVLETIEMSDDEMKDAYIERLEKGTDDGETAVPFTENGDDVDDGAENFEAKVALKVKDGMTKGEALSACSSEFPKLHKEYIARTNKARTEK